MFQAVTEINIQLGQLVTQSDHVFKESVSLHSEQNGMSFFLMRYEKLFSVELMPKPLCLHVIEVETEVVDKLKYIEETKETMDKNSNKLLEIKDNMKEIFAGKTQCTIIQLY